MSDTPMTIDELNGTNTDPIDTQVIHESVSIEPTIDNPEYELNIGNYDTIINWFFENIYPDPVFRNQSLFLFFVIPGVLNFLLTFRDDFGENGSILLVLRGIDPLYTEQFMQIRNNNTIQNIDANTIVCSKNILSHVIEQLVRIGVEPVGGKKRKQRSSRSKRSKKSKKNNKSKRNNKSKIN